MIRFEFHRRPLSLMVVREATPINHRYDVERDLWRPVYKNGIRWDRAIGLRVGYFPRMDNHGVQVMLWRKSVGSWWSMGSHVTWIMRSHPRVFLRHYWRNLLPSVYVGAPF